MTKSNSTGTILYFVGPETFRLREHVKKYFEAVQEKYGEFNVSKVDPAEEDFETLKSELLSPPFLGTGKRVFFLDSFPFETSGRTSNEKREKGEKIIEVLKTIPEEIVVICISDNPDRRTKTWKDLVKMADPNNSQEFKELNDSGLTQWIRKYVAQKGGDILPVAAEYLWQYAGTNLWNLAHEIEKLISYTAADRNPISERDIRDICDPSFETIQFAFSNAFATGKKQEVFEIFHRMVDGGHSAHTLLFRDFGSVMRQLILARYALDTGKSAKEIGMNPFVFGKTKSVAQKFPLAHLKNMHQKLVQIDEGTKTGTIPTSAGKEDLLIFALERWIQDFFESEAVET